MSIAPLTPEYARVIMGSAATFRPTCFMKTMDLTPDDAAAAAVSIATFSFTENSKYIPTLWDIFSRLLPISDEGVPGYVEANFTPASMSPRVIASFPSSRSLPLFDKMSAIFAPLVQGCITRRIYNYNRYTGDTCGGSQAWPKAQDLGSCLQRFEGSNPFPRTILRSYLKSYLRLQHLPRGSSSSSSGSCSGSSSLMPTRHPHPQSSP